MSIEHSEGNDILQPWREVAAGWNPSDMPEAKADLLNLLGNLATATPGESDPDAQARARQRLIESYGEEKTDELLDKYNEHWVR